MSRANTNSKVKVVYLVGGTRSGTTLLANILNEIDGFFAAGEVFYLWERGLREERPCGCGAAVPDCPVWNTVLADLDRDRVFNSMDIDSVLRVQADFLRVRHTWRLLRHQGSNKLAPPLKAYALMMSDIYHAISRNTGAHTIVDSSKRPSLAALLLSMSDIEPTFVQVVRDPRAVVYSWKRKKASWERTKDFATRRGTERKISRSGPLEASLEWLVWNIASESVLKSSASAVRVRYEDLVSSPGETMSSILSLVGRDLPLPFRSDGSITLHPNHTVSGNPNRFETGTVQLVPDMEWTTNQERRDRALSTIVTAPLLRHYGYNLLRTRESGGKAPKLP